MTYGTFRSAPDGSELYDPEVVEGDFAAMSAHGINSVRIYTVPPRWLLDLAFRHGLRVMVGLPWEQHVAFLESAATAASIEARVRAGVRSCAGHPAVLCYAIGNEIPCSIVRWYGRRRVEGFLRRLYRAAKSEDPGGLVTYVNYPSTEYLDLPFLDFLCFNLYLESRESLQGRSQSFNCASTAMSSISGLPAMSKVSMRPAMGRHGRVDDHAQAVAALEQAFLDADHLHLIGTGLAKLARRLGEHVRRPCDVEQLEAGKSKDGDAHG